MTVETEKIVRGVRKVISQRDSYARQLSKCQSTLNTRVKNLADRVDKLAELISQIAELIQQRG